MTKQSFAAGNKTNPRCERALRPSGGQPRLELLPHPSPPVWSAGVALGATPSAPAHAGGLSAVLTRRSPSALFFGDVA